MVKKVDHLKAPNILQKHDHWKSFRTFHDANPAVLDLILLELDHAASAGIKKVSIKTIIGKLKWDLQVKTQTNDEYKINDAFTSLYAAIIAKNWPEYAHMFEQRSMRAIKESNPC